MEEPRWAEERTGKGTHTPMGFLSEQRHKQIVGFARGHLSPGERVIAWARARKSRTSRSAFAPTGFLYVTDRKLIVHWAGQSEGHADIDLLEIDAWGVDTSAARGPVLGVKSGPVKMYVQMPTTSRKSAEGTAHFLRMLAERAPKVREPLEAENYEGTFDPPGRQFDIRHPRRSLAGHTKRAVVTLIGAVLMIVGMILTVLPGPAILFFIAGFAVLGSEYDWAQDALQWTKEKYRQARQKIKERRSKSSYER
jgi:uncharacterized protein (TIGR02611 family)